MLRPLNILCNNVYCIRIGDVGKLYILVSLPYNILDGGSEIVGTVCECTLRSIFEQNPQLSFLIIHFNPIEPGGEGGTINPISTAVLLGVHTPTPNVSIFLYLFV